MENGGVKRPVDHLDSPSLASTSARGGCARMGLLPGDAPLAGVP